MPTNALAKTPNATKSPPKDEESSERLGRWKKRWGSSNIGWHQDEVNESLLLHGKCIVPEISSTESCQEGQNPNIRVFVPLCGKTVDMAFLADHERVAEVIGCDGIRSALEEFQEEHPGLQIQPTVGGIGKFERLAGKHITLLKGDYFDLDSETIGGRVDSVWDRASIIAIQPNLREDYVQVMGGLVKNGGVILVSTYDRREGAEEVRKAGPPFSVDEAEIRRLYENQSWVESVTRVGEETDETDKFQEAGLTKVVGLSFVIQTK